MNDIKYLRLQSFAEVFATMCLHCSLVESVVALTIEWAKQKADRNKMWANIFSVMAYMVGIPPFTQCNWHSSSPYREKYIWLRLCVGIRQPHVLMTMLLIRHETIIIKNVCFLFVCRTFKTKSTLILHPKCEQKKTGRKWTESSISILLRFMCSLCASCIVFATR